MKLSKQVIGSSLIILAILMIIFITSTEFSNTVYGIISFTALALLITGMVIGNAGRKEMKQRRLGRI